MSVLLGLDVGTTGARAVAVDEAGRLVSEASSEYPLHTPHPGWTEQAPEDWWRGAKEALAEVASQVEDEVVGIGLTGQMHGSVFLNSSNEVIRPSLLWNDQRTEKQCQKITEAVGEKRLIQIAGNPALTGFQAPKVLWLRDEEPENYEEVSRVLLPKDYVRLRLTGEYATDASDAAGTLFLDVENRDWSQEILQALEVPEEWMPEVYEGPESAGTLREGVVEELGLPSGIPVAAGGGDNAAAAVGVGVIERGIISSSVGTSGVVFAYAEEFTPDPSGALHAFCHTVPGKYHLMDVTLSAGGSLLVARSPRWRAQLRRALRACCRGATRLRRSFVPTLPHRGADTALGPQSPRDVLRAYEPARQVSHDPGANGRCDLLPQRISGDNARTRDAHRASTGHRRRSTGRTLAPATGRHLWHAHPPHHNRRRSGLRGGAFGGCCC